MKVSTKNLVQFENLVWLNRQTWLFEHACLSLGTEKCTTWYMYVSLAKTLISLRISTVCPESLLGRLWVANAPMICNTDRKYLGLTVWMYRLILVFLRQTSQIGHLALPWPIWYVQFLYELLIVCSAFYTISLFSLFILYEYLQNKYNT